MQYTLTPRNCINNRKAQRPFTRILYKSATPRHSCTLYTSTVDNKKANPDEELAFVFLIRSKQLTTGLKHDQCLYPCLCFASWKY